MKVPNGLKLQYKCVACPVRAEKYFCHLSRAELVIFESMKTTRFYPIEARLFFEGQESVGLYMLCQGRVKLSMGSKDGRMIILQIAEADDILGLSEAVSGAVHGENGKPMELKTACTHEEGGMSYADCTLHVIVGLHTDRWAAAMKAQLAATN